MADTKRQRIEKRIRGIKKRGENRGTPKAMINREVKFYTDQLSKLPPKVSAAPKQGKKTVAVNSNDGFPRPKNKKVDKASYTRPQPSTAGSKATDTESKLAEVTKKKQSASGRGKIFETADQAVKRVRLAKAKPKLKNDRAEFAKAVKNMGNKDKSLSSNNPIFKEIIKGAGGKPAFTNKKNLSNRIGSILGDKSSTQEKMDTVVYNKLADEYNNDSGQMSEARKDLYLKLKNSKSGGKVGKKKGGMVKRSYGGKVKRNMGGMVSPRKKVVFRRGGGRALRGMGKAIYSNKMY